MPELPEVETVRRGLHLLAQGRRFCTAEIFSPRIIRNQVGGELSFLSCSEGFHVIDVRRHGKFLWILGENQLALVIHLGMSGQIRPLLEDDISLHRHERARFIFNGHDDGILGFRFIDQRIFGSLQYSQMDSSSSELLSDGDDLLYLPKAVNHIGPDVFDSRLDFKRAASKIRRSQSRIKNLLLDQRVVSGFGNIYADEALACAHINGFRIANKLRVKDIAKVLEVGKSIMEAALAAGGTSFDALYVDVNGESGNFAQELLVYGRSGQPCRTCHSPISSAVCSGRTHHFCPRCQKPPRDFSMRDRNMRRQVMIGK